jgi:hypothetical protein
MTVASSTFGPRAGDFVTYRMIAVKISLAESLIPTWTGKDFGF